MIDGHRCLAIIVARGGSKGLPGKNLADLGGRPLVAWSIAASKASKYLDRVILSSDDDAIMEVARAEGCDVPFCRPAKLASDESPVTETLLHALDFLDEKYDYIVLLQATSPLRNAQDIDNCIEACHLKGPAVVSISETAKPPEWLCKLDDENQLVAVMPGDGLQTRRQDLTKAYMPNGAVYVCRIDWFRKHKIFYTEDTVGYIMPTERSVDIDRELDLMTARWLLQNNSSQFTKK